MTPGSNVMHFASVRALSRKLYTFGQCVDTLNMKNLYFKLFVSLFDASSICRSRPFDVALSCLTLKDIK